MGSLDVFRKAPHQKTFGVEIECFPNKVPRREYLGFFYVTEDISLGYYNDGKEFVSQPLPYTMLIKQIKKLHKTVVGWRVDRSCGLHIHVSRAYWSAFREEHFTTFLRSLRENQITELFGRFSRQYANPSATTDQKFRAVNLLHKNSYEFRLWAAGDLNWTLEALRRTKLIVEYNGKWSYNQCLELFTKPEGLLQSEVAPQITAPVVRRVRRAPVVS